jgi:hypothetical protein
MRDQSNSMFIVQCKPRAPGDVVKVTTHTRKAALEAANDFLNRGMTFVTVIADGRVYMAEEFATALDDRSRTPVALEQPTNNRNNAQ